MRILQKIIMLIEMINEWVGRIFSCLLIPLMLIIVYEVFTRRLFGSPTVWTFEISMQLYVFVFMLAAPYTLLHNRHISIDILVASRLSPKKRASMDILTYFIFFFPFVLILLIEGFNYAKLSWAMQEVRHSASWAVPVYPIKTVIPVVAFLLLLQGIVVVIKKILFLRDVNIEVNE